MSDQELQGVEYLVAAVLCLVFGWALLARPPDFEGPGRRGLAIALVSIAFWGFNAMLVLKVFGVEL